MMVLGGYYSYDCPSELETAIENKFNITENTYSLMYSVYSFPNIVLPIFGGAIMDKIGYEKVLIIVLSLVSVGQIVVALGAYLDSFKLMLIGRAIYGSGSETLYSC
jgi:MFS family permease